MSKQVRFRRGTTAQHSTFTGPAGEITVDTDKKQIVVHDGVVAGGIPVARADRPRGWTKTEYFTANGTWTQSGKTDLKRVIVTCTGGGGGGSSYCGGGSGGQGMVSLEASAITSTVAVTIGSGGATGATGGTSSFGTYISATGGGAGSGATPGNGGSSSGSGVYDLGGQGGVGANFSNHSDQGGGLGGGGGSNTGKGIFGAGGSSSAGSSGSVIVTEIYGLV